LEAGLVSFARQNRQLLGLPDKAHRVSLVEQMVESLRRIEYVKLIDRKAHGAERADPTNQLFDPIIAASLARRAGNSEEACWLVFLAIHCGKNLRSGWRLARLLYGGLGTRWTWARVSANPTELSQWIARHEAELRPDGRYAFGNHRKYETLRPSSARSTGHVVTSYVRWVQAHGDHAGLFRDAAGVGNRQRAFDHLYQSMSQIMSFGRTAKFDYLTMLSKLGLADIEPGIPYMAGATGPVEGSQLLFTGQRNSELSVRELDTLVAQLGAHLKVGMQVMEDAICNWQKSPGRFRPFRG
jgi:hypothetical protein